MLLGPALGITTPEGLASYYAQKQNEGGQHGIDWMAARLVSLCRLTQYLFYQAGERNGTLFARLSKPVERTLDLENVDYESANVGSAYYTHVPLPAIPAVWGVTRMLVAVEEKYGRQMGDENPFEEEFGELLGTCQSPNEFFVQVAQTLLISHGFKTEDLVDLMLKTHIMHEQGNHDMYFAVIDAMRSYAHPLWGEVWKKYKEHGGIDKHPGWVRLINDWRATQAPLPPGLAY